MMAFNNDPTASNRSIDIVVPVQITNDIKLGDWESPTRRIGLSNVGTPLSTKIMAGFELVKTSDGSNEIAFHTHRYAHSVGERMRLSKDGFLGIGTSNPLTKLHIEGYSIGNIDVNDHHGGYEYNYRGQQRFTWDYSNNRGVAVYINGNMLLNHIWVGYDISFSSDERIKTNIVELQDDEALMCLRKIQPKKYKYKDALRGTHEVIGFIAQDVKVDCPHAHSIGTGKLPNINVLAKVDVTAKTLTFAADIVLELDENGDYFTDLAVLGIGLAEQTVKIVSFDSRTIHYSGEIHSIDTENEVFVYGQIVSNFQKIDKNTIYTMAVAALQELDRQLQAERVKTAVLESQIVDILARLESAGI